MADVTAVYLDPTDAQSARLWRWLGAVGLAEGVEVRPFCTAVDDPWECDAPPFSLELLMLLEQLRPSGPAAMADVVDAVFAMPPPDGLVEELSAWLAVLHHAGLDLRVYDYDRERLQAEVGYWQAEAIRDLGITRPATLVFADDSVMCVQLKGDITDPDEAFALRSRLCDELTGSNVLGTDR
jgi:hypothetical protein